MNTKDNSKKPWQKPEIKRLRFDQTFGGPYDTYQESTRSGIGTGPIGS